MSAYKPIIIIFSGMFALFAFSMMEIVGVFPAKTVAWAVLIASSVVALSFAYILDKDWLGFFDYISNETSPDKASD